MLPTAKGLFYSGRMNSSLSSYGVSLFPSLETMNPTARPVVTARTKVKPMPVSCHRGAATNANATSPPKTPGMPWRLWTPQVSTPPVAFWSRGWMMDYPTTLIDPVSDPINMLHPGVTLATQAPISTPPAREELAMSPMSILPLIRTENT